MDPRAVKKLLDNLRNDPQLRAEDDPTIVAEEQYPTTHHPIFGTCLERTKLHEITTMLQWKREHNAHNLPENSLKELKTMKDSLEKVFLLDLKINAPWEEMKFTAWRYKVTNVVISAVHVALKAEDDGEAVRHLFGTGKHSNPSITAGEKRNIQGHLICNPLVLDDPWDEPDDLDDKIVVLLEEREPYLTSLSRQPPYRDSGEFPREVDIAKNKLIALASSLKTVLRRIYKIASQTFHVLLWDLIPGARAHSSHIFTRIREARNQHLILAREANDISQVRHHSAKDTLRYILEHFVKESDDLQAISWMNILKHTRAVKQNIYEWCNSFTPLTRAYLRAGDMVALGATQLKRLNQCAAAQFTDFEQSVLVQTNERWKANTLNQGDFNMDELKKDISSADAKFTRPYKPTSQIAEYLTARALRQGVAPPSFLNDVVKVLGKRKPEQKGKGGDKRRGKGGSRRSIYSIEAEEQDEWGDSHAEHESEDWAIGDEYEAFAFQAGVPRPSFPPCTTQYCVDKNISHTHSVERCYKRQSPNRFSAKGSFSSKGKGRGALLFNSHSAKGGKGKSKGKGKDGGKGLGRGKGKGSKGKMGKGKDGKSSFNKGTPPQCYFCLEIGHIKAHCPAYLRLAKNPEYMKIRSALIMDQIYCYDLLEDTVGCEVCQYCLQEGCTYATCESPVEIHLMQDSTNSFIKDGMWDLVEEAKQWQPSVHLPLTKEMLLQQTFTHNSEWDEHGYPEDEGGAYGEELTMDVEIGSASVNEGVPVADEEGQDTDSDTYN